MVTFCFFGGGTLRWSRSKCYWVGFNRFGFGRCNEVPTSFLESLYLPPRCQGLVRPNLQCPKTANLV